MNRTYNATGEPGFSAAGSSAKIREEFAAVAAGFAGIEQEIDAKVFAASAPSEWVNPARAETYISATQFKWAGSDATSIMVPNRRIRCTVNGAYVYSEVLSSSYVGGATIVNLLDAVLTAGLTLVEYAVTSPVGATGSSLSLTHLHSIIDGRAMDTAEVMALIMSEVPPLISDMLEGTAANVLTVALDLEAEVATTGAFIAAMLPLIVDTSAGNVEKTLPSDAVHASYIKGTEDANLVTFAAPDGTTLAEPGFYLDVQYQAVNYSKVGTVWYRR